MTDRKEGGPDLKRRPSWTDDDGDRRKDNKRSRRPSHSSHRRDDKRSHDAPSNRRPPLPPPPTGPSGKKLNRPRSGNVLEENSSGSRQRRRFDRSRSPPLPPPRALPDAPRAHKDDKSEKRSQHRSKSPPSDRYRSRSNDRRRGDRRQDDRASKGGSNWRDRDRDRDRDREKDWRSRKGKGREDYESQANAFARRLGPKNPSEQQQQQHQANTNVNNKESGKQKFGGGGASKQKRRNKNRRNNNNETVDEKPPPKKEEEEEKAVVLPSPENRLEYRKASIYERVQQVGEGTYGKVYKARNATTNCTVALKRLRMELERDGFPITAVREIKLLQSLRHPNIVSLREMMTEKGDIYMAFEYMDHDLAGILSNKDLDIDAAQSKFLFKQMIDGLCYLHHKGILHRDIKGSNILVNNKGVIKLADFGLARSVDLSNPNAHYTNRVITLWYRPPELLLGATVYNGCIDVWGMGCLLVEIFRKRPLFHAKDEIGQLQSIYSIMGTPSEDQWKGMMQLPWYELLKPKEDVPNRLNDVLDGVLPTPACLDLAEKLLTVNPEKRITAQGAIEHEYFKEDPAPRELDLSNIGEWHDFEAKRRRRRDQAEQQKSKRAPSQQPPSQPSSQQQTQ